MGDIPMVHRLEQDPLQTIQTGDWVRVEADAGLVTDQERVKTSPRPRGPGRIRRLAPGGRSP